MGRESHESFIYLPMNPPQPLSPPQDARYAGESPAHYAERMREVEAAVRALLMEAQTVACKEKLDAGRVDTVFAVGDQVLLRTKELLDAADIGKLRPRWDGPFTVLASCFSKSESVHPRAAQKDAAQRHGKRGQAETFLLPSRRAIAPW